MGDTPNDGFKPASRVVDCHAEDCDCPNGCSDTDSIKRVVVQPPQVVIPPVAVTLGVGILSAGTVLGLHEFITLSFAHPDSANLLIPLLLVPLMQLLAKFWLSKRGKRDGEDNS